MPSISWCRGHFEVQLDVHELAQPPHVLVLDVPPILAQVHGDPVGAAQMRLDRRPHGIRLVRAACLPQRGHVVDVHAEFDHAAGPSSSSACRSRTTRRLKMCRASR